MSKVRSVEVCFDACVVAVVELAVTRDLAVVTTKEVSASTTRALAFSGSDSAVAVATKWRRRGRR